MLRHFDCTILLLALEGEAERRLQFTNGLFWNDSHIHIKDVDVYEQVHEQQQQQQQQQQAKSRKRRYAFPQRHVRSADIGLRTAYEVISAVDLAFTPNASSEGLTIFQSKMRQDVVYGICLPAPGFSALFVLLAMCVVISVLVASFLCYHRQLQKVDREGVCVPVHPPAHAMAGVTPAVPFREWSMVHYIRHPKIVESES